MTEDVMHHAELGVQSTDCELAPLQDAARVNRLLLKRCRNCRQLHWYPRARCPFCLSGDTIWEESSGEGTIYTFTIVRRSPTGPFALAYVQLDEGPVILSHIVNCRPSEVTIGKRVKVQFLPVEGGPPLPVFSFSTAQLDD